MQLRAFASVALATLLLLLAPGIAEAYPEFQYSTGNARCNLCHYSPTGGGLLNGWGRAESSDTISLLGGNGDFLYGVYEEPDWIKLGVDLRGATVVRDREVDNEVLTFPMQADTYVLLQKDRFSLYAVIGARAQARDAEDGILARIASREHYAMWKPRGTKLYVRGGRFLVPYGLRTQDHTWYVRRDLGLYAFEETYNLSGGFVERDSELHVTAFTPAPGSLEAAGPRESGGAAFYERRLGEGASLAAQSKIGFSDEGAHYAAGGFGKYWLEGASVLLMGELDMVLQTFDTDPGPSRGQLVSYLGASWFPVQGLLVTGAHQRFDEDLSVEGTARDAFSLSLQFFPLAKWELHAIGKVEIHGSTERTGKMGMLQLHYYL